jgi:lipoyl(octanoyl) transferase
LADSAGRPEWRLIVTEPGPGAGNMAVDEALMESVRAGGSPVLRFYDWQPACLSIGYFQKFAAVDASECRRQGIEIVRRLTGGNAILHRECVTYAVIVGTDAELVAGGVVASQRRLSAPFAEALREAGAPVAAAPDSAQPAKGFDCFAEPGPWELTLEGRKVLGSAQTRRRRVVLQHGSLMLGAHGTFALAVGGNGTESVSSCTSPLRDYLPDGGVGLREAIASRAAAAWSVELREDRLTAAEEERAADLAREKYTAPGWTGIR